MVTSKDNFLEQRERETYMIEMNRSFYERNIELLSNNSKIVKTIIDEEDEIFKDDEYYKSLLSAYVKANKALRNYKYDKRHNFKRK